MAGAVDLAALKARNDAAARAAEAPPAPAGEYVFDVNEAGFQPDVLDRSFQVPVLLVLTSPRAPSSDQLVASLETVVNAQRGTVVLGKVDADTSPRIVQALQALGYNDREALAALKALPAGVGVSDGIKLALKALNR